MTVTYRMARLVVEERLSPHDAICYMRKDCRDGAISLVISTSLAQVIEFSCASNGILLRKRGNSVAQPNPFSCARESQIALSFDRGVAPHARLGEDWGRRRLRLERMVDPLHRGFGGRTAYITRRRLREGEGRVEVRMTKEKQKMKVFELPPRPLGKIFRQLTHLGGNSPPQRTAVIILRSAFGYHAHTSFFSRVISNAVARVASGSPFAQVPTTRFPAFVS